MLLKWLEESSRPDRDEAPPLLNRGMSAFDTLDNFYVPGRIEFSRNAVSYGVLGVFSRQGLLPAVVVGDGNFIYIVVRVEGSFHFLEHDVFHRSSVIDDIFETSSRANLFYETLTDEWESRFCCTDVESVHALHRNCFLCTDTPYGISCLVQSTEGDLLAKRHSATTRRWFDGVLRDVADSQVGISRAFDGTRPEFRFVFQRFDAISSSMVFDEEVVDYEDDDDDDGYELQRTSKCASVDAIFHLATSTRVFEPRQPQQQQKSPPSNHANESPTGLPRAMPTCMRLRPSDTECMTVAGRTFEVKASFLQEFSALALSRAWEQKMLAEYVCIKNQDLVGEMSTLAQISMALECLTPPVVIIYRCSATHEVKMLRHGMQPVQIDFDEAHRLVHKHGTVFGYDECYNDVFHSRTRGRNIDFRLSDATASEVVDCLEGAASSPPAAAAASGGCSKPLKRLRNALGAA